MNKQSPFFDFLHIATLCTLAFAQPLFEVLSRNAEFFVVRGSKPLDVVLLVLLPCLLLPGLLVLCELMVGAFSYRLRRWLYALFMTALLALILLPILKQMHRLSAGPVVVVSLIAAIIVSVLYSFSTAVRWFFTFLSPALLVVPGLFLFHSPLSRIVFPHSSFHESFPKLEAKTPVVMLVLDELPLSSLMDEQEQIDPIRYSNFARLQKDSIWFRNTSSVSYQTTAAVPAILSGSYPRKAHLPTLSEFPHNLFTLLGGSYEMRVIESATQLCPKELLRSRVLVQGFSHRMKSLLLDVSAVYLHIVLPSEFTRSLPTVTETWSNFWSQTQVEHPGAGGLDPEKDKAELFDAFLESITPSPKPTLYFLHVMLPHKPWKYFPSGKRYNHQSATVWGITDKGGKKVWEEDKWIYAQALQRHLLQLGFTDNLLGKLIDRLKQTGLYDRALLVVTADHGISFAPGESLRNPMESNLPDILMVPLFIKIPGRQGGSIRDQYTETIDILPTMADLLEISLPWPVDGHTAFDPSLPEHKKRFFVGKNLKKSEFHYDPDTYRHLLERILSLFPPRTGFEQYFRIGPYPDLIGRRVAGLRIANGNDISVELLDALAYKRVDLNSGFVPALVAGRIHLIEPSSKKLTLAVAVNGVLRAVTGTLPLEKNVMRFAALVPEESFQQGLNDIQVFVVPQRNVNSEYFLVRANRIQPHGTM